MDSSIVALQRTSTIATIGSEAKSPTQSAPLRPDLPIAQRLPPPDAACAVIVDGFDIRDMRIAPAVMVVMPALRRPWLDVHK
jgi:hypothetical protein